MRNLVRHHIETGIWFLAAAIIWLASWFFGRQQPITLGATAVFAIVGARHFLRARQKRNADDAKF
ncbi:hypothetical protein EWE75_22545 [Sphingomonas populi]|uniref:Uncharacterized protein n=1 Tax=Sphingomonas populi TaxID=2484750 RepID=A0A4Q6XVS2_9SPHN|nr:hypothetical protein [Sphingomonas populi]RZF60536.1 hypothetical protein EWE75_22545 [Sphingomonas populi]